MAMGNVSFKAGFDAEDRVINILKTYDCKLDYGDVDLDHNQKLDFIVKRLPEIRTYITTGVQVTTNLDSASKMDDFLRVNRDRPATPRSLYIELGNGVDLEHGGGLTILLAIGSFALNRSTKEVPWNAVQPTQVGAVRIHPDLTYEFFSLDQRIAELRGIAPAVVTPAAVVTSNQVSAIAAATQISQAMKSGAAGTQVGELSDYNVEKGFGYIQGRTGEKYFVHMNYVEGLTLKEKLKAIKPDEGDVWARNVGIKVRFRGMGVTKPGVTTPEAREVVPLTN